MALSKPRPFAPDEVLEAPAEPGVYVLVGTRGVVNYVGQSPRSIRARLRQHLSRGDVPVSAFRFEIIRDAEQRTRRERSLVAKHMPDYNTRWPNPS